MDFMNRGQQSNGNNRPSTIFSAGAPDQPEQHTTPTEHKPKEDKSSHRSGMGMPNSGWFRWGGSIAVVIVALLIGAALALFLLYKPATEGDLVDTDKLQAVFLTNDQVYFGKITSINKKYVVLTNIYYLQTSNSGSSSKSSSGSSNISLVKLGCELHKPQDRMVIHEEQVSFWENLQTDGQVAKAVKSYQQTNPNGQNCSTASNNNTNPVQGGTTPTTNTNTNNTKTNQ